MAAPCGQIPPVFLIRGGINDRSRTRATDVRVRSIHRRGRARVTAERPAGQCWAYAQHSGPAQSGAAGMAARSGRSESPPAPGRIRAGWPTWPAGPGSIQSCAGAVRGVALADQEPRSAGEHELPSASGPLHGPGSGWCGALPSDEVPPRAGPADRRCEARADRFPPAAVQRSPQGPGRRGGPRRPERRVWARRSLARHVACWGRLGTRMPDPRPHLRSGFDWPMPTSVYGPC